MSDERAIEQLVQEFVRSVRRDRASSPAPFISRSPEGREAEVCGLLIVSALRTRRDLGDDPWLDEYLDARLWRHAPEVCRALGDALYREDDGSLARSLGVHEFGRYEAVGVVGFGGVGTILKCRSADGDGRDVAVKVAHRTVEAGAEMLADEHATLVKLSGLRPVPRPLDTGTSRSGRHYLAMDFVDGVPLEQWWTEPRRPTTLLAVAWQLTRAVQQVHESGCAHGDLTPGNVILEGNADDPRVWLVDFGNSSRGFFPLSNQWFTALYAAPELLDPEESWNLRTRPRTDVWSLGVLLHKLLGGGNHPFGDDFPGCSPKELATHFRGGIVRPPLDHLQLGPKFWDAVHRCTSRHPEERPSAADLAAWLKTPRQYLAEPVVERKESEGRVDPAAGGTAETAVAVRSQGTPRHLSGAAVPVARRGWWSLARRSRAAAYATVLAAAIGGTWAGSGWLGERPRRSGAGDGARNSGPGEQTVVPTSGPAEVQGGVGLVVVSSTDGFADERLLVRLRRVAQGSRGVLLQRAKAGSPVRVKFERDELWVPEEAVKIGE